MDAINKIIDFAEQVAKENEVKMKKLQEWEDYIKPLFKKHTGCEFNSAHVSLYSKSWQDWLNVKRTAFYESQLSLKEIKDYADLYGWHVTVLRLKKLFTSVSWAKNSKPGPGSLTLPVEKLKGNNDTLIKKVILHKNEELTLVTNQGWLRFLK